jgi:spectrin beta
MNLQAQIEAQFSELQTLASQRSSRLGELLKLYRFLREADEVAEWMGDQMAVAASEDYGRDVEHVELLIQTFDSFLLSLTASGGRVTSSISTARALIAEGTPEHERIQAKLDETRQLWEDLRELAHARQEVNHSSASRIRICGEVYKRLMLSDCLS